MRRPQPIREWAGRGPRLAWALPLALALAGGAVQATPVCVPLEPAGAVEPAPVQRCTEQQGSLRVQRSLSASGALLDLQVFDAQGRLVRSETLAGGRRIKRVYYPGGVQLRSETDLLERDPGAAPGREGVAREWAEAGQLTQETVWSSADAHSLTQWHLNGQVRLRQRSWRIARHQWRTSETFHENGQPAALNTERSGRLWGWQRYHDDAGRRLREDEHGEQGVLLQRRHFRPDGSLDREERFTDDTSRL
ncbi:MAG: hypothetical protein Q8K24_03945 [Hydrogenophaga sp.]|nr:hypothetical protein [Hydrogenophaga sp.]